MPAFQSLTLRPPASLETVHNILGSLVAHYSQEEVLTTVRQLPAREAKFRPGPDWVTSALSEAYRAKGIQELYAHQATTAELVHDGKNVVVVTPTASGKTLCYNLPVLNAVLENPGTRALYLFPTKAGRSSRLLTNSFVPAGPLTRTVTGPMLGGALTSNTKNGQHSRSATINSATCRMRSPSPGI